MSFLGQKPRVHGGGVHDGVHGAGGELEKVGLWSSQQESRGQGDSLYLEVVEVSQEEEEVSCTVGRHSQGPEIGQPGEESS